MSKIEQWIQEANNIQKKIESGKWKKKAGHGIEGLQKKKGVGPEEEVTATYSRRKLQRLNERMFELDYLVGRERRK